MALNTIAVDIGKQSVHLFGIDDHRVINSSKRLAAADRCIAHRASTTARRNLPRERAPAARTRACRRLVGMPGPGRRDGSRCGCGGWSAPVSADCVRSTRRYEPSRAGVGRAS